MGLLDYLRKLKRSQAELQVLLLGLDNAGKTSVVRKLSDEEINTVNPTKGFNVKSVRTNDFKLHIWDIGGQKSLRPYWKNYFYKADALVFVIDSADAVRFEEAAQELAYLLGEDQLSKVPLLIFANKQDLATASSAAELAEELSLDSLRDREWRIQACSAKDGEGLEEGLSWLIKQTNKGNPTPTTTTTTSTTTTTTPSTRADEEKG